MLQFEKLYFIVLYFRTYTSSFLNINSDTDHTETAIRPVFFGTLAAALPVLEILPGAPEYRDKRLDTFMLRITADNPY
jgi:hypothetical protein